MSRQVRTYHLWECRVCSSYTATEQDSCPGCSGPMQEIVARGRPALAAAPALIEGQMEISDFVSPAGEAADTDAAGSATPEVVGAL